MSASSKDDLVVALGLYGVDATKIRSLPKVNCFYLFEFFSAVRRVQAVSKIVTETIDYDHQFPLTKIVFPKAQRFRNVQLLCKTQPGIYYVFSVEHVLINDQGESFFKQKMPLQKYVDHFIDGRHLACESFNRGLKCWEHGVLFWWNAEKVSFGRQT